MINSAEGPAGMEIMELAVHGTIANMGVYGENVDHTWNFCGTAGSRSPRGSWMPRVSQMRLATQSSKGLAPSFLITHHFTSAQICDV